MGEMKVICEQEGIRLHTSVWYSPRSNGVAERTIGLLTTTPVSPNPCGQKRSTLRRTYIIGRQRGHWAVVRHLPDVSHLPAFGAPFAIVEPTERLRKLYNRATICFFVGYKYEGGGYRVWDPKRRVVVESRDLVFVEDGLPPPTLNDSRPQPIDEDEPTTQPALGHTTEPTTLPAAYPHRPYRSRPHQRGNA